MWVNSLPLMAGVREHNSQFVMRPPHQFTLIRDDAYNAAIRKS